MPSATRSPDLIDRQSTTPFHLKLFYRLSSFHHPNDFPIPTANNPSPPLPQHLQIYTWLSCSLLELSQLLTSALPNILPNPAIGTRLSFRLVYPDTRPLPAGRMREDDSIKGRWTFRDLGSVIVAADAQKDGDVTINGGDTDGHEERGPKIRLRNTEEAERTLMDARFVIGDYVDCAIFPPLADGSVAPGGSRGSYGAGFGSRGGPLPTSSRENGYGRPRGGGYGAGKGDGYGAGGNVDYGGGRVPPGEWRRGERLPDSGGYGRGYGGGRGRGRGGY